MGKMAFKCTHVVFEVKGNEARVVAQFERKIDSECFERAMNEMVKESWYHGDKEVVYCWCPADMINKWAVSYGRMIKY